MRIHTAMPAVLAALVVLTTCAQVQAQSPDLSAAVASQGAGFLTKSDFTCTTPKKKDKKGKGANTSAKDQGQSGDDKNEQPCFRLQPTWGERVARMFQYQFQITEQPRTVVISGVPTMNPEHYLQQHSLLFSFSELFPGSSDFAAMVGSAYTHKPGSTTGKPLLDTTICGDNPTSSVLTCIARGAHAWQRAIAGVKATFTVSERSAIQQSSIVPESFGYHYGYGGEVDFDPTNLFITSSNYQTALSAVKGANAKTLSSASLLQPMLEGADNLHPIRDKLLAALIPTFQYKRTTQFDFIKNSGGFFVPATFPETGLNSYTFTLDARRLFAPMKARSDAEATLRPPTPVVTLKFCVPIKSKTEIYLSVPDSFRPDACQNLATSMGAETYRLACVTKLKGDSSQQEGNDFTMMSGDEKPATKKPRDLASPPAGDTCHWNAD